MKINRRVLAAGIFAIATLFFVVFYAMPAYSQADTTTTPGASNSQNNLIAFSSQRDGHAQIYVMNSDGSNQTNISKNAFNETQPVWSPDGKQLAFVSDREGNPEICTMAADGSNAVCLTHNGTPTKKLNAKLPQDRGPVWSPDGKEIAFVSTRDGNGEIYAMNADGSNPLNLTNNPSNNDQPVWSHDLKQIAFVSDRDGNPEICVMDASGFNQRCLTNNHTANRKPDKFHAQDSSPAWSPDDQKLAFVSTRERNRNPQVFVMNVDGSNPLNLTKKISTDTQPAWSPDGSQIAFVSNREGLPNVFVMSADGTGQKRLTQPLKGGDIEPNYAPIGVPPNSTPTQTLTPTPVWTHRLYTASALYAHQHAEVYPVPTDAAPDPETPNQRRR